MKILHISDTHGLHKRLKDLPTADVIVHSGDFTLNGTEAEVMDFMEWFVELLYKHKVFVAGNHDSCLYGADIEGLPEGTHYLCGSGVTLDGVLFYGIPMFMQLLATSSNGNHYDDMIDQIPMETDVLITHQPPLGVLDSTDVTYWGDAILFRKIKTVQPKLHLFGHVHNSYGMMTLGNTVFSNASLVDEQYQMINAPRLLSL